MLKNPLFLGTSQLAFARNISFSEGCVEVRPSIEYTPMGLSGQYQGSTFYSPSSGLSAQSYSNLPNATAVVVSGLVHLLPIDGCSYGGALELWNGTVEGDANLHDSEDHLIVTQKEGATYWYSGGMELLSNSGVYECGDGTTHDTFDSEKHKSWLPNNASLGAYAHGRNMISVDVGCVSGIVASDLVSKRGCLCSDDILKTEEYAKCSYGDMITAPSRLGRTVALEVFPENSLNGEGDLYDFRECGVVRHNTLSPREQRHDATGERIKEGWHTQRITNVALQTIGAVGNHAVTRLPNDIMFRSQFGLHFLRVVLGQGTFNDETTNTISQDVSPLLDDDCDLSGASVGHWLRGSRFLATTGLEESAASTRSVGRGMVVMNQATTYTEDRTPRAAWEGLWTPTRERVIHKFEHGIGYKDGDGFIGSEGSDLFFGRFTEEVTGEEDGELIDWSILTGAYVPDGLSSYVQIKAGNLDMVLDESSRDVEVHVRTDTHDKFEKWASVSKSPSGRSLVDYELGQPNKLVREATWFQFLIKGKGYFKLRDFSLEFTTITNKSYSKTRCTPIVSEDLDYFTL